MTLFEWLSILASYSQLVLIFYGLRRMEMTGKQRDKQVDSQAKALEDMGAGIRALLTQSQS